MLTIAEKIDRLNTPFRLILFTLVVKITLFVFFHLQIQQADFVTDGLFVYGGDTGTYYKPVEDFVKGQGYGEACRMPGMLPIYAPLLFSLGAPAALNGVILLQLLLDIIAVIYLGKLGTLLFADPRIGLYSVIGYALSSSTSLWNHFGLADSFHISFLIIGAYLFFKFLKKGGLLVIVGSGALLTWSVFLRQIAVIPYFVMGISLLTISYNKGIRVVASSALAFAGPLLICLSLWAARNYQVEGRFIPLVKSMSKCWSSYPEHLFAVRRLAIDWGGDVTWGKEGGWLIRKPAQPDTFPFSERVFTSRYKLPELVKLRNDFLRSGNKNLSSVERKKLADSVSEISRHYREVYRAEHPLDYYVLNRLRLLGKFLFPNRLDNLPFPKLSEMGIHHIVIKVFYFAMILLVNFLGLIGIIRSPRHPLVMVLAGIPASITLCLACYFGWIEPRYFAPVYPFMLLLGVDSGAFIMAKLQPMVTSMSLATQKNLGSSD